MSTVGVISLGCSKNRVDSERILGCFADAGFTITPNPEEAEVLLVNTCGFITPARKNLSIPRLRWRNISKPDAVSCS